MAELPASRGRTGPVMPPGQAVEGRAEVASALVGIYRGDEAAGSVVEELRRAGVDRSTIRVGDQADVEVSLLAEMQQETSDALLLPQAGIAFPKESTKASLLLGPPVVIVCALIFMPLGFIPLGGAALWVRLLTAAAIGAALGGTIVAIAAPAMGAKRPSEANAAQRGVAVRVDDPSAKAEELMTAMDPIRLDRVAEGAPLPLETVVTEEQFTPGGTVEEIVRNAEDVRREDLPGRPHEGLHEHDEHQHRRSA